MVRFHGNQASIDVTRSYFRYVTQEVVLAVIESEFGEVQVETLLNRLTSWSVNALVDYMRIIMHSGGSCGFTL